MNGSGPDAWDALLVGGGDRPAVRTPIGRLTYRELDAASAVLARRIAARDAGGAPVLVYGHQEPGMLVGIAACARLGRPYVPVDAAAPPARVSRIAELAGARVAVAARPLPAEVAAGVASVAVPGAGDVGCGGAGSPPRAAAAPSDPLAYIMFTSGSTGDPKGVPVPISAVRHFSGWLRAALRPRPGAEVVLGQAPFSFDLSVMSLCLALGTGSTLFPVTTEQVAQPGTLFRALQDSGLTIWVSTPSFARFCLAEPGFGRGMLPALRTFAFCGEPLPSAVAAALLRRFPDAELWNTYGPTEATVAVTALRITPDVAASAGPLPVGRPVPGMRVWIAPPEPDAAAARPSVPAGPEPLPDGVRGEILIAGPQVASGYLAGTGGGSATRFIALPDAGGQAYRTGDAGRLLDGMLYCEGRLDRQVKLHGYRLELEEIEACLRRLPRVLDAAVLIVARRGVPDHLAAFVVEDAGPAPLPEPTVSALPRDQAVREALGRLLPAYALPRIVRFVPALPSTPNGKVDRAALARILEGPS